MTTKNDITGDRIATKVTSKSYRDNWERIFGKPSFFPGTDIIDSAETHISADDREETTERSNDN